MPSPSQLRARRRILIGEGAGCPLRAPPLVQQSRDPMEKPSMRLTFVAAAAAAVMGMSLAGAARGQDLTKRAVPQKWIEPYLPEDLPELELKEYVKSDALEKARAEAFAGRYKVALLTLAKAKPDADPVEVALVKAGALAPLGRRDEAIAALSGDKVRGEPRVQVLRARVMAELGRNDEAISLLKQHIAKAPESIAGHYWLGNLSEKIGDLATAREAYGWFKPLMEKWQGDRSQFNNAEEVTLIGRGLDRWATLTSAYPQQQALHNVILSMFLKAYDQIDRAYWPAHLAAAEYYIAHDDEPSALKELQKAVEANPGDIRVQATIGRMMVDSFNFDGADARIEAIRDVDPQAIEGELLLCRTLLQQRRPTDAQEPVRRVLKRQPKNLEAMGLLAATEALQLHDDQMTATLKQVEQLDPANATAYLEVAEQLGAMRQYPRAAAMYKVAIERAPWWTTARNGLGLLYTQSGDEDLARTTLDAAHALDPFNYSTTNYLRLLDELDKFARKETAHFVVMYDAAKDPMIPEYFGDYLESIYKQVCGEYRCEPPVKTYIEVFPTHDAFSVRTTGSPWIGTVGASTGRVIALVAPRKGRQTMGAFNWSAVLRHEFTHTVTLAATDNRIAHWLTEGLAVVEEHAPMRWEWVPMLYHAVTKKELFTMENLTWGFVRPKRPIDRQLAYAESYWICQYIEDNWGHEYILKMLAEFKKGREQRDVFPEILGESLADFQRDFFEWCDEQVAGWGYDETTTEVYDDLKDKAEELIKAKKYKDAVDVYQKIVVIRPVDALPHTRLAGLYLTKDVNEPEKAAAELIELHRRSLHDNIYAKRIARIYRDDGKLDEARQYALEAVYIDPYDPLAHQMLAELYEKTGDAAGLEREKRVMPVLAEWEARNKKAGETPKGR
jgi:tetratricopeptide (TPR) repeat protein